MNQKPEHGQQRHGQSRAGRARLLAAGALCALMGAALALPGGAAQAAGKKAALKKEAPLTVREIRVQSRQTARYTCEKGKTFSVTYLNTANGAQSFALVPIKGHDFLLVNVIAASGAKYAGDRYVWWTNGQHADLYDANADEKAPPIVAGCKTSSP